MKTPNYLLKLQSKFIYWKLNTYTESERTYPAIANSLLALEPTLFTNIKINTACIYYFNSSTQTLIELIDVLSTTNTELKNNAKVTKALQLRIDQVSIESFLRDSKSRYIDAPRALRMFKELALEYYTLHQTLAPFDIGIEGYNKRVLSVFTDNLSAITNALRSYSLG